MIDLILKLSLIILSLSILGSVYRVVKGPSTPDRVIALDAIGIQLIAVTAIFSFVLNSHAFLDVILLLGILAFIGTVAFSKFIEKGVVIEDDRNS